MTVGDTDIVGVRTVSETGIDTVFCASVELKVTVA